MIGPDLARRTPTQSIYPHDENNIPVQQKTARSSQNPNHICIRKSMDSLQRGKNTVIHHKKEKTQTEQKQRETETENHMAQMCTA
jgi:hypothetical protein